MSFRPQTSVENPHRWLDFAPIAGLAFGVAAVLASMACGVETAGTTPTDPEASSIEPGRDRSTSYAQTLTGAVTDTTGVAIAGALVRAGSREALSDVAGRFEITSVPVDAQLSVKVSVSKAGFVSLSRVATIAAGKTSQLDLTIKRDTVVATLSPGSAATITVPESGARIVIPAGALVDESGASPATDIDIHFAQFDPASNDIKAIPGNSIGRASNGTLVVLGNIVTGTIEARRGNQRFDVRPGAALTLELPVSAALNPSAGRDLSLSRYDADRGTWEEVGFARSSRSLADANQIVAVASIPRLGTWNVSLAFSGATDFRCDAIRVVDENGNSLDNVELAVAQMTKGTADEQDYAVSLTSARSINGFANLAPLVREARVKVAARQIIGASSFAGSLEFVVSGDGAALDAIFANGEFSPVVRRSANCADSLGLEIVLRADAKEAPTCTGRSAANGTCIRY